MLHNNMLFPLNSNLLMLCNLLLNMLHLKLMLFYHYNIFDLLFLFLFYLNLYSLHTNYLNMFLYHYFDLFHVVFLFHTYTLHILHYLYFD